MSLALLVVTDPDEPEFSGIATPFVTPNSGAFSLSPVGRQYWSQRPRHSVTQAAGPMVEAILT